MSSYADHLVAARAALSRAQQALAEEMRTYPTPISGCDAQYNHLIADRARILAALGELDHLPFVATPRTPYPGAGVESR
ncbi:MAG: hypothetical protein AAFR35_01200 [Pseudomonadota bacterium]